MPSQRKRIGFLPRENVQDIIDKMCKSNKLSQSKVTGILVEEALNYRGLLSSTLSEKNKEKQSDSMNLKSFSIKNNNNKLPSENKNINLEESYQKDEVQMINDFIEYKFFKNVMIQKNYK